jgi:hypothetical protein
VTEGFFYSFFRTFICAYCKSSFADMKVQLQVREHLLAEFEGKLTPSPFCNYSFRGAFSAVRQQKIAVRQYYLLFQKLNFFYSGEIMNI